MSQAGPGMPEAEGGGPGPRGSADSRLRFWLVLLVITLISVYLLRSVLLPFVAGIVVAYVLDPVCDRLQKWKLSRTWATSIVTGSFLLVCILVLLLVIPAVVSQIATLIERAPDYLAALQREVTALLEMLRDRLDPAVQDKLQSLLRESTGNVFSWATKMMGEIISGGVAFFNFLALVVITPVVAFYLLRDWDDLTAKIDDWLPRKHQHTIRRLAHEVDETLAGFMRGQGLVCLSLAIFYAVGLTLAGLDFGLVVGLIAGFLSFIPYVGSMVGLVLSVGLAFAQFDNWVSIAIVAAVFFVGQAIEGNILTPKLVGEKVGLHAVWVMFALLAGGSLFGFVGVLLAVPAAAVIGVGVRFALAQYRLSSHYTGHDDGDHAGPGGPAVGS
jgi:sporulation integral membrane protein YtvI